MEFPEIFCETKKNFFKLSSIYLTLNLEILRILSFSFSNVFFNIYKRKVLWTIQKNWISLQVPKDESPRSLQSLILFDSWKMNVQFTRLSPVGNFLFFLNCRKFKFSRFLRDLLILESEGKLGSEGFSEIFLFEN